MKLNFKVFGEGEPLIILHGLFGSLDNWQGIAKELSDRFRVYIVDQRNHGRSPHSEVMNYEVMANDLLELMDDQNLQTAHVMGHSMGGKTAMKFALTYPERCNKLIVVDIAPKAYPPGHEEIFRALFALDPSKISSRAEADRQLSRYIDNVNIRLFLLKNLQRTPDGHFAWKMNLPVLYKNYKHITEAIEASQPFDHPTLFIRSETSSYILDSDIAEIRRLFPKARIVTIKNTGHWIHAEAPEAFLQTVRAFLLLPS